MSTFDDDVATFDSVPAEEGGDADETIVDSGFESDGRDVVDCKLNKVRYREEDKEDEE